MKYRDVEVVWIGPGSIVHRVETQWEVWGGEDATIRLVGGAFEEGEEELFESIAFRPEDLRAALELLEADERETA